MSNQGLTISRGLAGGAIGGAATGAFAGAVGGTIVFPKLGTATGAVFGAAEGSNLWCYHGGTIRSRRLPCCMWWLK